jgi:hypothetical protein
MQELRLYNYQATTMTIKFKTTGLAEYAAHMYSMINVVEELKRNMEKVLLAEAGEITKEIKKPFMLRSNHNRGMANQSPYMVRKRIVDGKKTWGFMLENRKKLFKIDKDEAIKLVENYPKSVLVDFAGADMPVYLHVVEEIKGDKVKKYLRTIWDTTVKNNLNSVKKIKLISCNKLKVFKTPEKTLIAI